MTPSIDSADFDEMPNREDDDTYIVDLIQKVITVSLETVKIVKSLPDLGLPEKAEVATMN